MLFAVVPLLHKYVVFAAGLATLKVVFSPAQKLAVPEILGTLGKAFIVTTVAEETALVQPAALIARTVKLPAAETVVLFAVVPLLHK